MISITKQPDNLNLAGNRIPFVLTTNNTLQTTGVKSVRDLQIVTLPVSNETITFSWNGGSTEVEFRFSSGPNDSGTQVLDGSTYGNISDYLDMVFINALNANAILTADFIVSKQQTQKARFTARRSGVEYNLTITYSNGSSFGQTQITLGVSELARPNYKLIALLQLKQIGAAAYNEIELALTPIENKAAFDFSPILLGDWYAEPLPAYNITSATKFTNCIVQFYVRYSEQFGDDRKTQILRDTNMFYCMFGGYSDQTAASINFDTQVDSGMFLNFTPNDYPFLLGETIWLWWYALLNEPITVATVKIWIYYDDGDTGEGNILSISNIVPHSLFCLPITWAAVLAIASPKDISHFEIQVVNTSTPTTVYSEKRRFFRSNTPAPDSHQIVFKNSLGVFEIFHARGNMKKGVETKTEFASRRRNVEAVQARRVHISVDIQETLELNTGNMNPQRAKLYTELLACGSVYLLTDTKLIPKRITSQKAITDISLNTSILNETFTLLPDSQSNYPNHD